MVMMNKQLHMYRFKSQSSDTFQRETPEWIISLWDYCVCSGLCYLCFYLFCTVLFVRILCIVIWIYNCSVEEGPWGVREEGGTEWPQNRGANVEVEVRVLIQVSLSLYCMHTFPPIDQGKQWGVNCWIYMVWCTSSMSHTTVFKTEQQGWHPPRVWIFYWCHSSLMLKTNDSFW